MTNDDIFLVDNFFAGITQTKDIDIYFDLLWYKENIANVLDLQVKFVNTVIYISVQYI